MSATILPFPHPSRIWDTRQRPRVYISESAADVGAEQLLGLISPIARRIFASTGKRGSLKELEYTGLVALIEACRGGGGRQPGFYLQVRQAVRGAMLDSLQRQKVLKKAA